MEREVGTNDDGNERRCEAQIEVKPEGLMGLSPRSRNGELCFKVCVGSNDDDAGAREKKLRIQSQALAE